MPPSPSKVKYGIFSPRPFWREYEKEHGEKHSTEISFFSGVIWYSSCFHTFRDATIEFWSHLHRIDRQKPVNYIGINDVRFFRFESSWEPEDHSKIEAFHYAFRSEEEVQKAVDKLHTNMMIMNIHNQ